MTTEVEIRPEHDELTILDDQFAIELPCDIWKIWPELNRPHPPAMWIGVKACGHHRLMCEPCREMYLNLQAKTAYNVCSTCWDEAKFLRFELVDKRPM